MKLLLPLAFVAGGVGNIETDASQTPNPDGEAYKATRAIDDKLLKTLDGSVIPNDTIPFSKERIVGMKDTVDLMQILYTQGEQSFENSIAMLDEMIEGYDELNDKYGLRIASLKLNRSSVAMLSTLMDSHFSDSNSKENLAQLLLNGNGENDLSLLSRTVDRAIEIEEETRRDYDKFNQKN